MRVRAAPPEDFGWLVARTDCHLSAAARGIKVEDAKDRILGMVAFDGWTMNSCHAHMAADTPIAWRKLLPAAMDYIFCEAGLGVLLGIIPASNTRSLELAKHAGMSEVHHVRDGWAVGEDLVLLQLRKEQWLRRGGLQWRKTATTPERQVQYG